MRAEEAEAHASAAGAEGDGRNLSWAATGAEAGAAAAGEPKPEAARLERSNMLSAYEGEVKNQEAPGGDGLSVSEFKPWLQRHWVRVKQDLLRGVYAPEAMRKVEIFRDTCSRLPIHVRIGEALRR